MIKHGLSAYRNHVCRCDKCRWAHRRYELDKARKKRQLVKRSLKEYYNMETAHDTYTRRELEEIRNKTSK